MSDKLQIIKTEALHLADEGEGAPERFGLTIDYTYDGGRGVAEAFGADGREATVNAVRKLADQIEADEWGEGEGRVQTGASPARPEGKRVSLEVEVKVLDEAKLRKYAGERYEACWFNPLPDLDLDSIVMEALVHSNENPSNDLYGIEVLDSSSAQLPIDSREAILKPTVVLNVEVKVFDEKLLREYTDQRYKICWNAPLDEDMDLARVVLEAVVISNENPDPDAIGLELLKTDAHEI